MVPSPSLGVLKGPLTARFQARILSHNKKPQSSQGSGAMILQDEVVVKVAEVVLLLGLGWYDFQRLLMVIFRASVEGAAYEAYLA